MQLDVRFQIDNMSKNNQTLIVSVLPPHRESLACSDRYMYCNQGILALAPFQGQWHHCPMISGRDLISALFDSLSINISTARETQVLLCIYYIGLVRNLAKTLATRSKTSQKT